VRKLIYAFSLIVPLLIVACDDDDEPVVDPPVDIDECITGKASDYGDPIPGEFIVAFIDAGSKNGRLNDKAARVLVSNGIAKEQIIDKIEGEFLSYVLKLSPTELAALQSDTAVALIEPDRIISLCACFTVLEPRLVTWNVNKVGYGDGTGKTAWVMDTGIDYDHPDLNVDELRSKSFFDGETSGEDTNGHGTHVAGVIGAKNNNVGTLGVASGATLVSLKILDDKGDGRLSVALKALTHVKNNGKAGDVVNISMGLGEISEVLESEIRGVANKGIFVAIAAGNENRSANDFSPARTAGQNIYTVSAVDSLNRFASFSNYGSVVDYAAPGVRILSTYKDGKYAIMSGTSMATPHVAGILLINNGKLNSSGFAINDPDGTPDPVAHQ
jgi:subtilisin